MTTGNTLILNADQATQTISRHIYGHFAEHLGRCIYEGLWVGEDSPVPNTRGIRNDVMDILRRIQIPNLRWPGGCFAEMYHWQDGIGPRASRPQSVNHHWGGVVETNHFGTHEFMDLCGLLACEPYFCGNVSSGSVHEMQQWYEYLTYPAGVPMAGLRAAHGRQDPWKVTYWGVGNENWGCGGNMRPQYYADLYRQFQTFLRPPAGAALYKVAGGPAWENYEWTEVLMREAGRFMDGLSFHYYVAPRFDCPTSSATRFEEPQWFDVMRLSLRVEEQMRGHLAIMDRHDPQRRIGLIVDEWGTWYHADEGFPDHSLYQQNSLRDALSAAIFLNVFNQYAHRVHMANIAQTINVLQAVALTDGPRILMTPTGHVFEMFAGHQDARLVPQFLTTEDYTLGDRRVPALQASASRNAAGAVLVTLCHLDPRQDRELTLILRGMTLGSVTARILTAPTMQTYNTFDHPETLAPVPFTGFTMQGERLVVRVPAKSVMAIKIASA